MSYILAHSLLGAIWNLGAHFPQSRAPVTSGGKNMASLFSALTVAVGGLSAQSAALGNISDNLSNAQTTGFKTIGTNFEIAGNAIERYRQRSGRRPRYASISERRAGQSGPVEHRDLSGHFGSGLFRRGTADPKRERLDQPLPAMSFTPARAISRSTRTVIWSTDRAIICSATASPPPAPWIQSTTSPIQVSALLNNPVATSKCDL